MKSTKVLIRIFILVVFAFINVNQVFSQDEPPPVTEDADAALEEEMRWLQAETYVITPSGIPVKLGKTPYWVYVITDRQMREMGARDLADMLRAVPSFTTQYIHVNRYRSWPGGTGVILMVNNHPVNDLFTGWPFLGNIGRPVDNIKRIEIVGAHASSIFGVRVSHMVINIITKEAEDIDGLELTARGGSYDTQQYDLLFGKTFNELDVAFDFNYFKSHGYETFIEEDYASIVDQRFGTDSSHAPGHMKTGIERYSAFLTLDYKGFRFDGRYGESESDRPLYQPFGHATLSEEGASGRKYYLNLTYERPLWEKIDFFGKVWKNNSSTTTLGGQLWPPGGVTFAPWGPAPTPPEGLIREWSYDTDRTGIGIQTVYKMTDSNTLLVGASYERMKLYDYEAYGNVIQTPSGWIPLPSVQDISHRGWQLTQPARRTVKSISLEDLWDITDDLSLNLVGRYDDYSDFGGYFNTNAGFSWQFTSGYYAKLFYGRGHRVPTFRDLYWGGVRNPDLKPDRGETVKFTLDAQLTPSMRCGAWIWYYVHEEDTSDKERV